MAKIGSIMLDLDRVEKGTWIKHPSGVRVCVASINSKAYKQAREIALRPRLRDIRSGALTYDDISEILKPVAAEHLLLGWSDLEDANGQPIPYSPAKALEYFQDPRFAEFYRFILDAAGEAELYRQDLLEESAKNSRTSSSGNSPGDNKKSS